jgi:hypothetical protein
MDIERLLTNRYFCLALLVIIVILVYMIYQKSQCKNDMEGLNDVPLMNGPQHLIDLPYEEGTYNRYRSVNGDFDKLIDDEAKKKLKVLGLDDDQDYLRSTGDTYREYSKAMKKYIRQPLYEEDEYGDDNDDYPRPLDRHPELSQCQPCKCDRNERNVPSRDSRRR